MQYCACYIHVCYTKQIALYKSNSLLKYSLFRSCSTFWLIWPMLDPLLCLVVKFFVNIFHALCLGLGVCPIEHNCNYSDWVTRILVILYGTSFCGIYACCLWVTQKLTVNNYLEYVLECVFPLHGSPLDSLLLSVSAKLCASELDKRVKCLWK